MKPCQTCGQIPCLCVKAAKQKQVWIIQDCSTPGCFTIIRSKAGQQETAPICTWCAQGVSHALNDKAAVDPRRQGVEVP